MGLKLVNGTDKVFGDEPAYSHGQKRIENQDNQENQRCLPVHGAQRVEVADHNKLQAAGIQSVKGDKLRHALCLILKGAGIQRQYMGRNGVG